MDLFSTCFSKMLVFNSCFCYFTCEHVFQQLILTVLYELYLEKIFNMEFDSSVVQHPSSTLAIRVRFLAPARDFGSHTEQSWTYYVILRTMIRPQKENLRCCLNRFTGQTWLMVFIKLLYENLTNSIGNILMKYFIKRLEFRESFDLPDNIALHSC